MGWDNYPQIGLNLPMFKVEVTKNWVETHKTHHRFQPLTCRFYLSSAQLDERGPICRMAEWSAQV